MSILSFPAKSLTAVGLMNVVMVEQMEGIKIRAPGMRQENGKWKYEVRNFDNPQNGPDGWVELFGEHGGRWNPPVKIFNGTMVSFDEMRPSDNDLAGHNFRQSPDHYVRVFVWDYQCHLKINAKHLVYVQQKYLSGEENQIFDDHPAQARRNAAKPLLEHRQPPSTYTFITKQVDGHPDVVARDAPSDGNVIARIPNGRRVTVTYLDLQKTNLIKDCDMIRILWEGKDYWVKITNVIKEE